MRKANQTFSLSRDRAGTSIGGFAALAEVASLGHAVSTREGPDFSAPVDSPEHAAAAAALSNSCDLPRAAWMRQVHGGDVLEVKGDGLCGDADALVTRATGIALIGRSADCPLILAAALDGSGMPLAVGIAHASWRGTVARVAANMMSALHKVAGDGHKSLIAAIAPSAGPCCYKVGPELRDTATAELGPTAADFFDEVGTGIHFDLWRANSDQLLRSGLTDSEISIAGICTICENRHFFSYRRDGARAGRFAAAIGIRQTAAKL